jgi:excisionase family DNA binding protein
MKAVSTGNAGLDALADAIADRIWARLQDKLDERGSPVYLIGIPEAAQRIGIKKTKMHQMIASGEIPGKLTRRIGRRVLIVSSELDRWIAAQ